MATWADFCISAVRYNPGHQHIDSVRVHQDGGKFLGSPQVQSRQQVISAIKAGKTYVTIFRTTGDQWKKGQPVIVVRINGTEYIKTTNNGRENDNLENLPEF